MEHIPQMSENIGPDLLLERDISVVTQTIKNSFCINTILLFSLLLVSISSIASDMLVERRRDQYGKDFSYYIYPIAGDIPGLGRATGVGGSVLNMFDTDADFTGFNVQGDFEASGYTFLDLHLIPKRLIFDVGYYDFTVAPIQYNRGIDSSKDEFIHPKVKGDYFLGQLTLTFKQRQIEAYLRHGFGNERLLQVLDEDENEFEAIDKEKRDVSFLTLGATFDLTDDRLDPRKGTRFEAAARTFDNDNELRSDFFVMDYNLTHYIPYRRWDSLAMNLFVSRAHVTRKATTDFLTLQQQSGLGCADMSPGPAQDNCLQTETTYINSIIAQNQHGTASSLGGTQRLRSYDNQRYFAGNALFYGVEYRWNLTDEYTPFNIYMAKGVRTGLQIAFFAEQGSVSDKFSDLLKDRRTSYGIGFRVILSGVIIRADFTQGDEGKEFVFFITYPWSMFSVDSPG